MGDERNSSSLRLRVAANRSRTNSNYRASKQVAERIQNSILPNNQKTIALVRDGFSKGQFEVNRLLQAQRNLVEVAREHIEASEKAWTTTAEISGLVQLEEFPLQP